MCLMTVQSAADSLLGKKRLCFFRDLAKPASRSSCRQRCPKSTKHNLPAHRTRAVIAENDNVSDGNLAL